MRICRVAHFDEITWSSIPIVKACQFRPETPRNFLTVLGRKGSWFRAFARNGD